MKKILLVLAVAGVLVSCGTKDETVKTESVKTNMVTPQKEIVTPEEAVSEATTTVEDQEEEKTELTDKDYKSISEPVTPILKKHLSKVNKTTNKSVTPTKVEEKVAPAVVTKTFVDKVIDKDVDKKITEIEIDSKKVDAKPLKEEKSNKTLYGAIAAIVVAAGAVVAFKKK